MDEKKTISLMCIGHVSPITDLLQKVSVNISDRLDWGICKAETEHGGQRVCTLKFKESSLKSIVAEQMEQLFR